VDIARRVTGHLIPVKESPWRAGDPPVLVAGSERIKKELGWKPHYADLKTILEKAWGWMLKKERG
jgi:UDP-glucose 4-epimerase